MSRNSILIADSQFLTRQGLKECISANAHLQLVAEISDNYNSLMNRLKYINPNILLIDYLFDKFDRHKWQQLIYQFPVEKILIVTDDENRDRINYIIRSGVNGFVTKKCSEREIHQSIEAINCGQRFFCNKILELLLENNKPKEEVQDEKLTNRELEVLQLVAKGLSTPKIAESLHLSIHTINSHRKNMLRKLNLKSPTELVVYALESGLVKP